MCIAGYSIKYSFNVIYILCVLPVWNVKLRQHGCRISRVILARAKSFQYLHDVMQLCTLAVIKILEGSQVCILSSAGVHSCFFVRFVPLFIRDVDNHETYTVTVCICTLASAIKSKMATNAGGGNCSVFFAVIFQIDHDKYIQ